MVQQLYNLYFKACPKHLSMSCLSKETYLNTIPLNFLNPQTLETLVLYHLKKQEMIQKKFNTSWWTRIVYKKTLSNFQAC